MSELLAVYPDGPFHQLVRAHCEGRELDSPNIAVLAIGGTEGAGITSTGKMIEKIVEEQEGINVEFFSTSDEVEAVRRTLTGRYNEGGYFQRDPNIDRSINLKMASHMIDPKNANSLVIVEGRLAPYIAKKLQAAAHDIDLPLPADIVTVYLTTRDREVGYIRKYLDELKDNPTIDRNEFFEEMERKSELDLASFWRAYPELTGTTPYSFNFQMGGKGVYDLRYDTAAYNAGDVALQILTEPKVEKLLSILPHQTEN